MGFGGKINKNSMNLATVIGVYSARRVNAGNALFKGQPAAGPHLCFVAFRNSIKMPVGMGLRSSGPRVTGVSSEARRSIPAAPGVA